MSERIRGVVKSFKKGYGFILSPGTIPEVSDGAGGSRDVFVHFSFIEMDGYRTLKKGQIVEYELVQTDKGLQAHHVVVISDPEE